MIPNMWRGVPEPSTAAVPPNSARFISGVGVSSGITEGFVRVVIDPFSAPYLAGSEIDFVDALMGAGFAINNPNVQAACGCGSSFQAKEGAVEGEAVATSAGGCGSGCGASS